MKEKLVVMLSGKIGSGKNTLAEFLLKELGPKASSEYFARPLKELCRDSFAPLAEYLNINHLTCGVGGDWITPESWFEKKTPITRMILQIVGTEIVRRVDPTYWSRMTMRNIFEHETEVVVITDWRFPNELEWLADRFHTLTIRVNRDLPRPEGFHEHPSETALDSFEFDRVINNDGSLEDLKREAHQICYHIIEELMP